MAEQIVVEISLDDKSVKQGFDRIQKSADDSAKKIGLSFKNETASLGRIAGGAAIGGIIAQSIISGFSSAFRGIKNIVSKGIDESIQEQNAIVRLNTALQGVGRFTQQASQDFQNFATQVQQTQNVADDTTLSLLAYASAFTKTNEQTKLATQAAIDFAAATGQDAQTALRQLIATQSGAAGRLGQLIPELRSLTQEQLRSGDAIDIVAEKFRGFAAQQTQTFSGALLRLNLAFGDLQQSFGDLITQSPAIIGLFNGIANVINNFRSSISSEGDPLRPLILGLVDFTAFSVSFVGAVEQVTRAILIPFQIIGLSLPGIGITVLSVTTQIVSALNTLGLVSDNVANQVAGAYQRQVNAASAQLDLLKQNFDKVFNPDTTAINNSLAEIRGQIVLTKEALVPQDQAGGAGGGNFLDSTKNSIDSARQSLADFYTDLLIRNPEIQVQLAGFADSINAFSGNTATQFAIAREKLTEFANNTNAVGKTFQTQFRAGFERTVTDGLSRVGASLVKGSSAFDGFGLAILGIMGDIAIETGKTALFTGKTIEAVKSSIAGLTGGPAIAAGIALIAFGGLLKALSGKGSASSTGSVPFGSTNDNATPVNDVSDDLSQQEVKPQTQVAINVQGNILDRRETGLEIAKIIQESFDNNDAILVRG